MRKCKFWLVLHDSPGLRVSWGINGRISASVWKPVCWVHRIMNESTALQLGSSKAARHRVEAPGISWLQITDCPEISVDWIGVSDAVISVNGSFSQERCRSRGWSCVLPCFAGPFRGALPMWNPRRRLFQPCALQTLQCFVWMAARLPGCPKNSRSCAM